MTKARKAISNFKLRENVPIGVMVTLRRERMWEFFDRLVNVALPRVRDFHGISEKSFDGRGNYSLGPARAYDFCGTQPGQNREGEGPHDNFRHHRAQRLRRTHPAAARWGCRLERGGRSQHRAAASGIGAQEIRDGEEERSRLKRSGRRNSARASTTDVHYADGRARSIAASRCAGCACANTHCGVQLPGRRSRQAGRYRLHVAN